MNQSEKLQRFMWRAARNALCLLSFGRDWLYPPNELATRFGRADAEYAWQVFVSHAKRLNGQDFSGAQRVLEIGPGRNLGTALLWRCQLSNQTTEPVEIVCWDVFKNALPETSGFWSGLARELLDHTATDSITRPFVDLTALRHRLVEVADGLSTSGVTYCVMPLANLTAREGKFDLIYSQAAIEHVWFIDSFWNEMASLTADGGWHSHRIDLADHGRRNTNYIEMLQWSTTAYWLTQRFLPGAINRWRASDHLDKLKQLGFQIKYLHRDVRDFLPVSRDLLAAPYRNYDDVELRCTGLDLVARGNVRTN